MRWIRLLAIIAALFLAGCASFVPSVDGAADAYDRSLVGAETWICRAASVGSVIRAYAVSDELWNAYLQLCGLRGRNIARPDVTPRE